MNENEDIKMVISSKKIYNILATFLNKISEYESPRIMPHIKKDVLKIFPETELLISNYKKHIDTDFHNMIELSKEIILSKDSLYFKIIYDITKFNSTMESNHLLFNRHVISSEY